LTTVGDYAAQAVINVILGRAFPDDPIVAEEDAAEIRDESSTPLRDRIVELANEALTADLRSGDNAAWGIGPGQTRTTSELLDAIDRGNHDGVRAGREFSSLCSPY
jgi:3'(2'), 5'-bisphosphate nucleotidase